MKHKQILLVILLLTVAATSCFAGNNAARFNMTAPTGTPYDYISLGLNAYNPLFNGASGVTIEGWLKPETVSTLTRVFHTAIDGPGTTGFAMEIEPSGKLVVYARSKASDAFQAASTATGAIAVGNWCHFAMVTSFAAGDKYVRLYINGTLAAENNSPTFASTTYVAGVPGTVNVDSFGRYTEDSHRPYVGLMDEFRFWKYARSITEIQADMNRELTAPYDTRLIGYWNFNEGT